MKQKRYLKKSKVWTLALTEKGYVSGSSQVTRGLGEMEVGDQLEKKSAMLMGRVVHMC